MKILITNVFVGIHIILNIFIAFLTIPILLSYAFMDFADENIPLAYKLVIVVYLVLMSVAQIVQAFALGMRTSFQQYFRRACFSEKIEAKFMYMNMCKKALIVVIVHFAALFFLVFFISVYVKYYSIESGEINSTGIQTGSNLNEQQAAQSHQSEAMYNTNQYNNNGLMNSNSLSTHDHESNKNKISTSKQILFKLQARTSLSFIIAQSTFYLINYPSMLMELFVVVLLMNCFCQDELKHQRELARQQQELFDNQQQSFIQNIQNEQLLTEIEELEMHQDILKRQKLIKEAEKAKVSYCKLLESQQQSTNNSFYQEKPNYLKKQTPTKLKVTSRLENIDSNTANSSQIQEVKQITGNNDKNIQGNNNNKYLNTNDNLDQSLSFQSIQCIICLDDIKLEDMVVQLKCSKDHIYHFECLKGWFREKSSCPLCRQEQENLNRRNTQIWTSESIRINIEETQKVRDQILQRKETLRRSVLMQNTRRRLASVQSSRRLQINNHRASLAGLNRIENSNNAPSSYNSTLSSSSSNHFNNRNTN
eukprot:403340079